MGGSSGDVQREQRKKKKKEEGKFRKKEAVLNIQIIAQIASKKNTV